MCFKKFSISNYQSLIRMHDMLLGVRNVQNNEQKQEEEQELWQINKIFR
jgi:hypothetical protein